MAPDTVRVVNERGIPPPPPMPSNVYTVPMVNNNVNVTTNVLPPQKPTPPYIIAINIVITLTHMSIGAISIIAILYATFWRNIPPYIFELESSVHHHVYLCVIGYIILMSQAVLGFNSSSGWSMGLREQTKTTTHWLMQCIGSLLALVGSLIKINDQNTNFDTAHGILGLVALIFTVVTLVVGVLSLSSKLNKLLVPRLSHAALGVLTLVAAYLCLCFGFNDITFRAWANDTNANLCIALTAMALTGIIVSTASNITGNKNVE